MKTILLNIVLIGSLLSGCMVSELESHPGCYFEATIKNKKYLCNTIDTTDNTNEIRCWIKDIGYVGDIDLRIDSIKEVCIGDSSTNE